MQWPSCVKARAAWRGPTHEWRRPSPPSGRDKTPLLQCLPRAWSVEETPPTSLRAFKTLFLPMSKVGDNFWVHTDMAGLSAFCEKRFALHPSLSPSYSMLGGRKGGEGQLGGGGREKKKPMNLSRYYDGNDTRVAKMSRWSFCLGTNYSRLRVPFSLSLPSLVCAIGCMLG